MSGVPAVLAAVTAISAIGGGVATAVASKKRNKAESRARKIEQAAASLENQRRIRRAIAQRRIQEAEIQSLGVDQGVQGSSSIAGARSSLVTQTGANIGAARTQFGAEQGRANVLASGYRKGAKYDSFGSILGSVGQASQGLGGFIERNPDATLKDFLPTFGRR